MISRSPSISRFLNSWIRWMCKATVSNSFWQQAYARYRPHSQRYPLQALLYRITTTLPPIQVLQNTLNNAPKHQGNGGKQSNTPSLDGVPQASALCKGGTDKYSNVPNANSTANREGDWTKKLHHDAEKEKERRREKEIRALKDFSNNLRIKKTGAGTAAGGVAATSQQQADDGFAGNGTHMHPQMHAHAPSGHNNYVAAAGNGGLPKQRSRCQ